MSCLFLKGRLRDAHPEALKALFERGLSLDASLPGQVAAYLEEVKKDKDDALRKFAERFDGVSLTHLEVPRSEWEKALSEMPEDFRRGLERAVRNLKKVARASLPRPLELEVEEGIWVGRTAQPLASVGVYAPGGTAVYPSSVLMGVVPAKAAGVPQVVLCSPPMPNGLPHARVLAAAALAGADRVFALGGAGAIGALAYGTQTVPAVDRIVGPGNAWVAEAKRQVSSVVGIDAPAGPSEILVVADEGANAQAIAREMLAQAEHDKDACVVALLTSAALAQQVEAALEEGLSVAERRTAIETALRHRGAVLSIDTLEEAWPFVERFAPEHLQLATQNPNHHLAHIRNAGTVFLGDTTSVAFGDYLTGANHVLPTAGAARRLSGLSVLDFVRWQTWQTVDSVAAKSLARDVEVLARGEGLPAHAVAAVGASSAQRDSVPSRLGFFGRPDLRSLSRYVPKRPPCEIDLTDNTNLFGPPPSVRRILATASDSLLTRYPEPYAERLRETLATHWQVPVSSIVTGCGSDDVLDAAMRAFAQPFDTVAYCPPTFSIIPAFASANGLTAVPCRLSAEDILKTQPRLIYLCSPNNPTGSVLPEGLLETLLENSTAHVVLDEAYQEYADGPGYVSKAARHPRLLVVKTLSKAFGLAGMRVGYAVTSEDGVAEIEKTRGPYKVGRLSEALAVSALTEGKAYVEAHVKEVKRLRRDLFEALVKKGFSPLPSQANFLLVPVPLSAETVADRMRERGVSVRAFSGLQGIGEAVRISLGPSPWMDACLQALFEAVA